MAVIALNVDGRGGTFTVAVAFAVVAVGKLLGCSCLGRLLLAYCQIMLQTLFQLLYFRLVDIARLATAENIHIARRLAYVCWN